MPGIWDGKTTVYPGALALVPAESPARALWATYKPEAPPEEKDATDDDKDGDGNKDAAAPAAHKNNYNAHVNDVIARGLSKQTTAKAIASGERALRCRTKKAKKKEPFFDISVYATLFPGTTYSNIEYYK